MQAPASRQQQLSEASCRPRHLPHSLVIHHRRKFRVERLFDPRQVNQDDDALRGDCATGNQWRLLSSLQEPPLSQRCSIPVAYVRSPRACITPVHRNRHHLMTTPPSNLSILKALRCCDAVSWLIQELHNPHPTFRVSPRQLPLQPISLPGTVLLRSHVRFRFRRVLRGYFYMTTTKYLLLT